jgi:hypothetical protein
MKNEINNILINFVNSEWSYSKFSYEITPLIFKAIDREIEDEEIRKWLLGIFDIVEVFLDDEFFMEYDLKKNLKDMING